MATNDPRLQMLLDEATANVDIKAELRKIMEDVKIARGQTVQQAASSVKAGKAAGPMDITEAIVPRELLQEHDLTHTKIAVFKIRNHVVYEIALKSKKAQQIHPRRIQEALKKGLGAAFTDNQCSGWRDEWIPSVWGLWVRGGLKKNSARPYFCQVVPSSIESAVQAAIA